MLDNPFFHIFVAGALVGVLLGLGGFRVRRARSPLRYRAQRRFLVPTILSLIVVVAGSFFFTDVSLVSVYWRWAIALAAFPMVLLWIAMILPRVRWGRVVRLVLLVVFVLPATTGWLWRLGDDPRRGAVTFQLEVPEADAEVVVGTELRAGDALRFAIANDEVPTQLIPRDARIQVRARVLERIAPLWWWYPSRQVVHVDLRLEQSGAVILTRERESSAAAFQSVVERYGLTGESVLTVEIPQRSEEWLQPGGYDIDWDSQRNRLSGRYTGR